MRWTQATPLTKACACGRRSRVVLTPRRWRQVSRKCPRGDGGKQARSPRRARRKPLKPLRREGRAFRRTCGFYPCAFLLHRGLRVRQAPGFPCALLFLRDNVPATTRTHRAAGRLTRMLFFEIESRCHSFYPPLEGEGRLRLSAAKSEPGWGDLSTQALFERRDFHPTPARIVLRTDANRPSPSRGG
jgi:hypothetical protein